MQKCKQKEKKVIKTWEGGVENGNCKALGEKELYDEEIVENKEYRMRQTTGIGPAKVEKRRLSRGKERSKLQFCTKEEVKKGRREGLGELDEELKDNPMVLLLELLLSL